MKALRVCLIDDDRVRRENIGTKLRARHLNVEPFSDTVDFVDMLNPRSSAVLILGLKVGRDETYGLIEAVARHGAAVPIIILTEGPGIHDAVEGVRRGALGFLMQPSSIDDLEGIVTFAVGALVQRRTANEQEWADNTLLLTLSRRELDILDRLKQGSSDSEIADDLGLGTASIDFECRRIAGKLAVADRHHAVQLAERHDRAVLDHQGRIDLAMGPPRPPMDRRREAARPRPFRSVAYQLFRGAPNIPEAMWGGGSAPVGGVERQAP